MGVLINKKKAHPHRTQTCEGGLFATFVRCAASFLPRSMEETDSFHSRQGGTVGLYYADRNKYSK